MAESQTEVAEQTARSQSVGTRRLNPALQPLETRKLRHVHHGQTGAMWTGVVMIFIGFVLGAIGLMLRANWTLFVIGAVIAALGIVVGLILQAMGFGLYEKKKKS